MNIQELFSLKGKTAIVTGGGRGLGQQIAAAYAEAGANIAICSRNLGPANNLPKSFGKKGFGFLASDASNYVYGHILAVDGGTTASV